MTATGPELTFNLAIILAHLADVEKEIEAENKTPRMKKDDLAILWLQKGTLLDLAGDSNQKQQAWQKAYQLDPENPVICERLQS